MTADSENRPDPGGAWRTGGAVRTPEEEETSITKTWFITGTSKGFGREWAEAALDRGDNVAATARRTEQLQPLTERYGAAVLPIQLDVTDRATAFAAVQQAAGHFGSLDIVVNNAATGSSAWWRS